MKKNKKNSSVQDNKNKFQKIMRYINTVENITNKVYANINLKLNKNITSPVVSILQTKTCSDKISSTTKNLSKGNKYIQQKTAPGNSSFLKGSFSRNQLQNSFTKTTSLKNSSTKTTPLKNSSTKTTSLKNSSTKTTSLKNSSPKTTSLKNSSPKTTSLKNSSPKTTSLKNSSTKTTFSKKIQLQKNIFSLTNKTYLEKGENKIKDTPEKMINKTMGKKTNIDKINNHKINNHKINITDKTNTANVTLNNLKNKFSFYNKNTQFAEQYSANPNNSLLSASLSDISTGYKKNKNIEKIKKVLSPTSSENMTNYSVSPNISVSMNNLSSEYEFDTIWKNIGTKLKTEIASSSNGIHI